MSYRSLITENPDVQIPIEYAEFIMAFRYRMIKIAYLTRFYATQSIENLGDIESVLNELYKMPELFRELARSITGEDIPDEIVNLLLQYEHRLKSLVDSIITNDPALGDESIQALYQLATEIATELSTYNPAWDKSTLEGLLLEYFKYVVAEVIAIKAKDFAKGLDIFDEMVYKAINLGDYYSQGLLKMAPPPKNTETISLGELNIIKDMKLTATQLAYLSRFYAFARIAGISDSTYVAQRLYGMPLLLHEKSEMILGYPNSQKLLDQFTIYIVYLEAVINSIMSGDQKSIESSMDNLYLHSNQIAGYLGSIIPYWTEEKWKNIFYAYNTRLIDEVIALQNEGIGTVESPMESLPAFEKMLQSALEMGDYFAEGLSQYVTTHENPPILKEPWEMGLNFL